MLRRLKYAVIFGFLLGILIGLSYLSGLMINLQFAPGPLGVALFALVGFAPIMVAGGLILGMLEAFLLLWLQGSHPKWFWAVAGVISLLLGGLGSFFSFSLWIIFVCIVGFNLLLVWGMMIVKALADLRLGHVSN